MQIVVIILGVIIVVLGAVLIFVPEKDQDKIDVVANEEMIRPEAEINNETVVTDTEPTAPNPIDTAATTTLTADVSYLTPARTSHDLSVSLVVDTAGMVTDAKVVYDKGEGFSNAHQERFDTAYKTEVIGKSLENISLSRVGGASLTSSGFNDAVAKIRAERG